LSDLHNTRLPSPAWRASLAAALCTDSTDAVEPASRLVPVQIVAAPDRDTLKPADSRAGAFVRVSNLFDNRNHILNLLRLGRSATRRVGRSAPACGSNSDAASPGAVRIALDPQMWRTHADSVS